MINLKNLVIKGTYLFTKPKRRIIKVKKHKVFTSFHRKLLNDQKTYLGEHQNVNLIYGLLTYFIQSKLKDLKLLKLTEIVTNPQGFRISLNSEYCAYLKCNTIVNFKFDKSFGYRFTSYTFNLIDGKLFDDTFIKWQCTDPDGWDIDWIEENTKENEK